MDRQAAHEIAETWLARLGPASTHQREVITAVLELVPEPHAFLVLQEAGRERERVLTVGERYVYFVALTTPEGAEVEPDQWSIEVERQPLDGASASLRAVGLRAAKRAWMFQFGDQTLTVLTVVGRQDPVKGEPEHFARCVASHLGFEPLATDPLGAVG